MSLTLVTAPTSGPVTLDQAKTHVREDSTDFDAQIAVFIKAATRRAEWFTGRSMIDQTWQLTLDGFPHHEIKIPRPPLIEIVSVKYDDAAGEEQTLGTDRYSVDNKSEPGWIVPVGSWPSTFCGINAVRIQFRCGYLDQTASPPVANVPEELQVGILMLVGTFNLNRENEIVGDSVAALPFSVEALWRPYRNQLGMA